MAGAGVVATGVVSAVMGVVARISADFGSAVAGFAKPIDVFAVVTLAVIDAAIVLSATPTSGVAARGLLSLLGPAACTVLTTFRSDGRRAAPSSPNRAAAARVRTKPAEYTASSAAEPRATRLLVRCLLERERPDIRYRTTRYEGWSSNDYGTGVGFVASNLVRRYKNSCPS